MSEVLERWKLVADEFTKRVNAVGDNQWDGSTPCAEFSVRQLVSHTIDVQRNIPKLLGSSGAIDTPSGDDLKSTWQAVRAAALAAYSAEGAMEKEVETPFGKMPAGQFMGGPVTGDALIHTWDLARATGGDETLPDSLCQIQLEGLKTIPAESLRQPGRFDAAIEPPAGANAQTQLLCYTGRQL